MTELRKPKLSELIRKDLSTDRPAGGDERHAPSCSAPKALAGFACDADYVYRALKAVEPVLDAVASDDRVPKELRQVATFWSSSVDWVRQMYEQGDTYFEWWFAPALKGPDVADRTPLSELHQGMFDRQRELLKQVNHQPENPVAEGLLDELRVAMATLDVMSATGDAESRPAMIEARVAMASGGYFRLKRIIEKYADELGVDSDTIHESYEERYSDDAKTDSAQEAEELGRAIPLLQERLDILREAGTSS